MEPMPDQENVSSHSIRTILARDFVLGFLGIFAFLFAYFALVPTLPIYFAEIGLERK